MKLPSYRILIPAVVALLALVGTAVWISTQSSTDSDAIDPRFEFVKNVAPVCETFFFAVGDMDIPPDLDDTDHLSGIASKTVQANEQFIEDVRKIPAPGKAQELKDLLIHESSKRIEYSRHAVEDPTYSETPQLVPTSFERIGKELDPYGESYCGELALPGARTSKDVGELASEVGKACTDTNTELMVLDEKAANGDLSRVDYATQVQETLSKLAEKAQSFTPHPIEENQPALEEFVQAVNDAASAAGNQDPTALSDASVRWVEAASSMNLGECTLGFGVSVSSPSGFLVTPPPLVELTDGVSAEGIANVEAFLPAGMETIFMALGVDPATNFSVNQAVAASVPGLSVVASNVSPSATTVSVAVIGGTKEEDPYQMFLVFKDTQNKCGAVRFYGFPQPYGFEQVPPPADCKAATLAG